MNWKLLCRGLGTVWLVAWGFIAFMTYSPPFVASAGEATEVTDPALLAKLNAPENLGKKAKINLPPGYKLDTPKRGHDYSEFLDAPSPERILQNKQIIGFSAIGLFGFAVMFVIAAACPATKEKK